MTIRSYVLAFAAAAAAVTASLSPADASWYGHRHFGRVSHHFMFTTRPGVNLCRRGIVYVCQ